MIILIGASASGKTEAAKMLGKLFGVKKVVTTTTRAMRVGETDGVDYFFVSQEEFARREKARRFAETAVYSGNHYGTGLDQIGSEKVLIVEPQGYKNFRKLNDPTIISFFIDVPESLRGERMRLRGDKEENIARRLSTDRVDFDRANIGPVDFVIDGQKKTVEQIATEIYELYQKTLKERITQQG